MPLAALLAVVASCALALIPDPRGSPVAWSLGMVAWGAGVTLVAGRPVTGRGLSGRDLLRLGMVAAMVRLPLLAVEPTLSDDLYRFTWEGRLWWAGFSPFAHAPADAALASLRDDVWSRVNHPEVSSIYPPVAQLLFAGVAAHGVAAWRLFTTACDVGTACLLARREGRAGWTWALLPLPAVEAAVGGHLEAVGCALVALAVVARGRKDFLADAAALAATLTKLIPVVLLARRPPRVLAGAALVALVCLVPLLGEGALRGFETYRANWSFNGSVFPALVGLGVDAPIARQACQAVGAAVAFVAVVCCRDDARRALWVFGAFVVLSPTVHPWYGLWPLLPALLLDIRAWVWLANLLPLAYLVLATLGTTGSWTESVATRWAIYLPFYVVLLHDAWRRWRAPSPHPVH